MFAVLVCVYIYLNKFSCGMAQWSSVAASLDRWIGLGPCRCGSPPAPSRAAMPRRGRARRNGGKVVGCASVPREQAELPPLAVDGTEEEGVGGCGACGGAGWVLCDFCQGKKNNVKSETGSRVYRRCPTCKAAGFILCPRCRVYKCVTFPESTES